MPRKSKYAIPEEKKELLLNLIETYNVRTTGDLQAALKDLLGGTIQTMLEQEIETQMEEREAAEPDYSDSRNGYKDKTLKSTMGEIPIRVPQDRNSDFEPMVVPKYRRDISEIEGKIIAMYARGMSTRQISDQIKDIYGFDVSEGLVTGITNKLLPEIESWQKRPLSAVYPIVFIDCIVFNVREDNVIRKQAAYVILGVNEEGHKEVLSITVGETESAKFWLSVLNELKNRGVKDILVLCADGLSGIKEAIAAAYPMTEYQRCIVHMVRNTLKYVADKDKKAFANDLRTIYHAPGEEQGHARLQEVAQGLGEEVPRLYAPLGGQLGRCKPHVQVLSSRSEGHLYDQRDRESEQRLSPLEPGKERLPKLQRPAQGPLPGYLPAYQEMDASPAELGCRSRGIGDHVPGSDELTSDQP